jgi:membrane-associated phospholipid phosphatase
MRLAFGRYRDRLRLLNRTLVSMQRRSVMVAMAIVVAAGSAGAQSDTTTPPRPLFTWQDGLLGWAFLGVAFGVAPLDKHVSDRLQQPQTQENNFLQKTSTIVRNVAMPGSIIIGTTMYAVGRITKSHRTADLGLHGTEALFVGEGLAGVMKGVFGRERPYMDSVPDPYNWQFLRGFRGNDGYRSFPSGHSVAAFAAAAAVSAETSRWWPSSRWLIGSVMYGGAGAVGVSRMDNNRPWASDVLVGAAIGTFAGNKVVRYHHSHPGNRLDEWLVNFSITPTATGHLIRASIYPRVGPPVARGRR